MTSFLSASIVVTFLIFITDSAVSADEETRESGQNINYKGEMISDEDSDSSWDDFDDSSQYTEEDKIILNQTWGPTVVKVLSALRRKRGPLDASEYSNDFNVLIEASKLETTPIDIRCHLAFVLLLCATPETVRESSRLYSEIALNHNFSTEKRIDALEELQTINFDGNHNRAYEIRTLLARDLSFSSKERCDLACWFLYSRIPEYTDHAIILLSEILSSSDCISETYEEIMSKLRFLYSCSDTDLFERISTKITTVFGVSKSLSILERFHLIGKLLLSGRKDYCFVASVSDVEKEVFREIKQTIPKDVFLNKIRSRLGTLKSNGPEVYLPVIDMFYETSDHMSPPLSGNLVSFLSLIGVDYHKEYKLAEKRLEQKQGLRYIDVVKEYEPTKIILDAMIEQARTDTSMMEALNAYCRKHVIPLSL